MQHGLTAKHEYGDGQVECYVLKCICGEEKASLVIDWRRHRVVVRAFGDAHVLRFTPHRVDVVPDR